MWFGSLNDCFEVLRTWATKLVSLTMVGKMHPEIHRWKAGRFEFDLIRSGLIMGILNVTPDSFSDGGRYFEVERAVKKALAMSRAGAAIVDIGGESTRPGADAVGVEEEMERVLPILRDSRLTRAGIALSVDTSKAVVAAACIREGADIVNDITGLRGDPRMIEAVAQSQAGLVIMHMQGKPRTMQVAPAYGDVVDEVGEFLERQLAVAEAAGVERERVVVDPGIGFGKTLDHNLALLRAIPELIERVRRPVLVGVSRKSMFAPLVGADSMQERLWPTVATTCLTRELGARIHRVHDVVENAQALKMTEALLSAG